MMFTVFNLTNDLADVEVIGSLDQVVVDVTPLDQSAKNHISFVRKPSAIKGISLAEGAIIIVPPSLRHLSNDQLTVIVSEAPDLDFMRIFRKLHCDFDRALPTFECSGIHDRAVVHETAVIEEDVTVEPGAVIGKNVLIAQGTYIGANAVIGDNVTVGRRCYIGANSVIHYCHLGDDVMIGFHVSLGSLGFGLVKESGVSLHRLPHIGKLIIQRDVHIGSGTHIDRSTLTDSYIGEGTRIDAMVRIAHNCQIGRNVTICSMTGVAGGTILEDWSSLLGVVKVAGHLTIGQGAIVYGGSVVRGDVPAYGCYSGAWVAKPHKETVREHWVLKNLAKKSTRQ